MINSIIVSIPLWIIALALRDLSNQIKKMSNE